MTDGLFRYSFKTFWRELAMMAAAIVWWIPFYFLAIISVKPTDELFTDPNGLPNSVAFSNYADAWHGVGGLTLGAALKSSLIITFGSVILLVLIGSLAAYAIARREGRLGAGLYLLFVVGIIIPFQLGVIPAYISLRAVGLVGTYLGTILLYTGLMTPLSVFLYTGFVRRLPLDYEEAAYVDGASRVRTFVRVVFPLLRPVTATVAVLTAVIIWNDFFVQLLFLSGSRRQTLPVAVYAFVGQYATQWNLVFASVVVAILPVLVFYIVAQRQLIRGFSGGIKT